MYLIIGVFDNRQQTNYRIATVLSNRDVQHNLFHITIYDLFISRYDEIITSFLA